jgi:hypothetical protein
MLKLTYAEAGLYLEHLIQPLEDWITLRILLSMRAGRTLSVTNSYASILLPSYLVEHYAFPTLVQQQKKSAIELVICEPEYVEISLYGTWVTSTQHDIEGVFITTLESNVEEILYEMWQQAQTYIPSCK